MSKICSAIEKQQKLEFVYKGRRRKVEPFCHGRSKKGRKSLRAYQTEGGSVSGKVPDWKFFTVSKISGLEVKQEKFSKKRPKYNPRDEHMRGICCNV